MTKEAAITVVLSILQYYGMEGDGGRKYVAQEIVEALGVGR